MKLLVHACCGPCSIMPTRLLKAAGHDITVLYANSNIAPKAEYHKRLSELKRYAASHGFPVIEGTYDPDAWERQVAPIGEAVKDLSPALRTDADARLNHDAPHAAGVPAGTQPAAPRTVAELLDDENRKERCRACYRQRLEESAAFAAQQGFEALSTTLAVSPYQFTDIIREELDRACRNAAIKPLFEDWRPYYDEATRTSRQLNMYRQNYCGCRFSVKEGAATRAFIKEQRARDKARKAAERAHDDEKRRARAAEKQAYAEERARRRAILKQLRGR